ncbi:MAG: hypothetical protein K2R98_20910 [Gemmataceae bacterium]|nr:hypothetical protein [Gemmataceae bacterium]
MGSFLKEVIVWAFVESPLLLTLLGGVTWALVTWRRHPKVSLLAGLGLTAKLVILLSMPLFHWFAVKGWEGDTFNDFDEISTYYKALTFVHSLISAGLWLLILFAIFTERNHPEALDLNRKTSDGYPFVGQ